MIRSPGILLVCKGISCYTIIMSQKIALVLSGGGARGIAHIGVIEELEKRGYEVTSLAGTSMGALVGGIYALDRLREFKEWLFTLDRLKVFNLVDFTLSRQGLVKGDRVLKRMEEFIPDGDIENLRIPYAAVAADILNREEVVFTRGGVYDAIRASISIPTVFTPVRTRKGLLVDGGVINNIPIKHVQRHPGDTLVVVNVNADIPVEKPPESKKEEEKKESAYREKLRDFQAYLSDILPFGGEDEKEENLDRNFDYFDLINMTISSMTHTIAQNTLRQYSPDLLIQVSGESCGTFDFFRAEEMVEMGRHAAATAIEKFPGS